MTEQQIRDLLADMQRERDAFVAQANQEIVFRNGQISALELLLANAQKSAPLASPEAEQRGAQETQATEAAADTARSGPPAPEAADTSRNAPA